MDLIDRLTDGSLMPHGHCLLWRWDLLLLHLGGDIITTIAYFTIPAALIYLIKSRKDLQFDWIFLMFALFIFFCGMTHVISIINIWHGYYFLAGVTKTTTGIVSLATAVMVWRLMPKALAIPSHEQLHDKVRALEEAEASLASVNAALEMKVAERTLQLEQLAKTDELTGLNNRREILDTLAREMDRSNRYQQALTIQIIDLDHFKHINDWCGHNTGDIVLAGFARLMMASVRSIDFIGRLGGEEFLILMPSTTLAEGQVLAERLRENVAANAFAAESWHINVTCSIGLAEWRPDEALSSLLDRADQAMYTAKAEGRNLVRVAG